MPLIDYIPKSIPPQKMTFKGADQFQRALKVPELFPKPAARKSNINKLFPYINDPDNKVFQNITVLPVKVFYDFEPLKDTSEKMENVLDKDRLPVRESSPINVTSLSETDELDVSALERTRPSTAGDRSLKKKVAGRRRIGINSSNHLNTIFLISTTQLGTPKSPTSRQNSNKFPNFPSIVPGYPMEVSLSRKSKEMVFAHHETSKISPRRQKFKRSSSLGKSTESDNPGKHL